MRFEQTNNRNKILLDNGYTIFTANPVPIPEQQKYGYEIWVYDEKNQPVVKEYCIEVEGTLHFDNYLVNMTDSDIAKVIAWASEKQTFYI